MEKFIEVHDNVLDSKLVTLLEKVILTESEIPFKYVEDLTHHPTNPNFKFKPGIQNVFISRGVSQLPSSSFFNSIVYNFSSFRNIIIKQIYNGRIFIDLPTPSPKLDLPPHIDLQYPHWVCLYYVNDSEGDTVFFDENQKEIKRVSPKKGRIAFFDGSIYHAGTPSLTKSRAVVNINFSVIDTNSSPYL